MTYRLLQLNMQKGSRLAAVIRYIRSHSFDIVCLQEVAGGQLAFGNKNCYEEILKVTGMQGQMASYLSVTGHVSSFIGNATLYKKNLLPVFSHTIWLKPYQEMPHADKIDFRNVARCAIITVFQQGGEKLLVVNTHLAWGPTPNDAPYKRNQAEKLYRWIRAHDTIPFVLTGDFNLNPQTKIVTKLSTLGINLTKKYKITNTLNPRTHYAKNLFPSGLPVDYVIADKRIHIGKFFTEEHVDLSDHYGLVVEFSV